MLSSVTTSWPSGRAALATEWVPLNRSRMRIGWDCERKGRGRASRSAREGRAASGAMAVEVSVGCMSVEVAVGYVRWVGVGARVGGAGRGALGERPNGEGVEWEERGVEREWDGRRGRFGILGRIEHAVGGLDLAYNPYTTADR
jgi:hypothetical protein